MAEGAVPMRTDIRDRLHLAVWNELPHDARVDVIKEMTKLLTEAGYDLELLGLASYRCAPQPQITCHWRDRATGLTFALVPGGTFRPGFDAQLMRKLVAQRPWLVGWDEEHPASEKPFLCETPWSPDHLAERAQSTGCPPLLMACVPLVTDVPGLEQFIDPSRPRLFGRDLEEPGTPLHFFWSEVGRVLTEYRWALPSSAEFEWGLRGGVSSLFYWGDEVPETFRAYHVSDGFAQMILPEWFDPAALGAWPQANRFGLIGMVAWPTWCAPAENSEDPYPLVWRGGAAVGYPWQDCGEWLHLLNACELRSPVGSDRHCTIRPIIRLA
jgi:hypothetical protein